MKKITFRNTKLWYRAPRFLSLLFVGFLSLFSLDVFSFYSGWAAVVPLLMHLIPSFVLLAGVIFAWKYDVIGGVVFVGFAVVYVLLVGFDRPWSWYAAISGPSFLIGFLFFLNWYAKKRNSSRRTRLSGTTERTAEGIGH